MLVALALGPAWAIGPLTPPAASAADTLPACRYDDIETVFTSADAWQRTLVDTIYMIGRSYVPPDLVPVTDAGISGNGTIRSIVVSDLRAMAAAARAAGAPIAVQSAYRSYATQVYTFNYWTREYGSDAALLGSARPGHSEHQLGVAMDFRSAGTSAEWVSDWATTPAGAWMEANAWRYGFVMSYPKDASPGTTCYRYEPWHYRYVGRDEATAIHVAGTTLREFLWYRAGNDVMAAESTAPGGPPTRTTRASPSVSPTASATLAPGAIGTAGPRGVTEPSADAAAAVPLPTQRPTPEGAVQAATGAIPARSAGSPLDLLLRALGIMLGIVVGLAILVGAERLDRGLRELARGLRLA
jgi:D-alanyl-D-alanine carboxypeptidase